MKETLNNEDSCNLEKRLTNIEIKSTPVSSVAGEKFDWEKVIRQRKLRNLQHAQTLENAKYIFVNGNLQEQDNNKICSDNAISKVKKK